MVFIVQKRLAHTICLRNAFAARRWNSDKVNVMTQKQLLRTLPPSFWRSRALDLQASGGPAALCNDPQARLLVNGLLTRDFQDELERDPAATDNITITGVQSSFMDRFVLDAVGKRIRQVVILGSGMDSRVYRLDVPPQLVVCEVDEKNVHEAKLSMLEAHGQRTRCSVRRVPVELKDQLSSADIVDAVSPTLNAKRPTLFLLDGALTSWSSDTQMSAVAAAAALAGQGSMLVGPAPPHDVTPILKNAGFGQVNHINNQQLQKIYRRPVPSSVMMLVAMKAAQ